MKRFKTYIPVLEEEFERLKEQRIRDYNPKVHVQANLESEVDEVLANSELRDDEKLRVLQLAMNRIQALFPKEQPLNRAVKVAVKRGGDPPENRRFNEEPTTQAVGVSAAEPADARPARSQRAEQEEQQEEKFEEAVGVPGFEQLSSLLPTIVTADRRDNANALLAHLSSVPGVTLGQNFQVVYKGNPVPGAYLLDVIEKFYRKQGLTDSEVMFLGPFVDFLGTTNVNPKLVCKQSIQTILKPFYTDPSRAPSAKHRFSVPSFSLFPRGDPKPAQGRQKRNSGVHSTPRSCPFKKQSRVLRVY